jgi:hypothetical protein
MAQSLHSSNHLLASLHADKMAALLPHLKVVELPQETVLYERGDTIKLSIPHHGVISGRGSRFRRHDRGRHGQPGQRRRGLPFDNQISLNRAVVQIAGRASAQDVDQFRALAAPRAFPGQTRAPRAVHPGASPAIRACNATHARGAPCAARCRVCWTAKTSRPRRSFSADAGVRRTSVPIVAHTLQQAGMIHTGADTSCSI